MPALRLAKLVTFASITMSLSWPICGAAMAVERDDPAPMRTALHIPWAVGGLRTEANGSTAEHPGEWPSPPVQAVRLWDTRTAWLNLEPAQDQWDFAQLDAHLAKARANGVDHVTLVLWGTPRWSAQDTALTDAPWLGPGSAAPPSDLTDWVDYVHTVADRYRGQIDAYQIGNEPNLEMFWRGTNAELIQLVVSAAECIKATDPLATVVGPPFLFTQSKQLRRAIPLWHELAVSTTAIDAWSLHWYPAPGAAASDLARVIAGAPKPIWLTEVGLPDHGQSAKQQVRDLLATKTAAHRAGVTYLAWYAWTDLGPRGLIDLLSPRNLRAVLG
jgi:hypothetical protein